MQIFGTIIADLFLVIAPLLPSFSGTMPKVLIEPAAIGVGLGLVSCFSAKNVNMCTFFPNVSSTFIMQIKNKLKQYAIQSEPIFIICVIVNFNFNI